MHFQWKKVCTWYKQLLVFLDQSWADYTLGLLCAPSCITVWPVWANHKLQHQGYLKYARSAYSYIGLFFCTAAIFTFPCGHLEYWIKKGHNI